jgi:hypothetical protein
METYVLNVLALLLIPNSNSGNVLGGFSRNDQIVAFEVIWIPLCHELVVQRIHSVVEAADVALYPKRIVVFLFRF